MWELKLQLLGLEFAGRVRETLVEEIATLPKPQRRILLASL